MEPMQILTASEQVAARLREEILRGQLTGMMPGSDRLARELRVGRNTIDAALAELEGQGLLVSQGVGKKRRIVPPRTILRDGFVVKILPHRPLDSRAPYFLELQHQLRKAGFDASFADGSLSGLSMDVKRVARFVGKTQADAWIVASGGREVLEWFAEQPVPAFAFFGRMHSVSIAGTGPVKTEAFTAAIQEMIALGHRRIVMMVEEERRKPHPGHQERLFLDLLESHGIPTGAYNLPDFEATSGGLRKCMERLFDRTPPTAMILDGTTYFFAVRDFLANRNLSVPGNVSLLCMDPHSTFHWCDPKVSHLGYDQGDWIRRAMNWVNQVAMGRDDRRKRFSQATFYKGGTIGEVGGVARQSAAV